MKGTINDLLSFSQLTLPYQSIEDLQLLQSGSYDESKESNLSRTYNISILTASRLLLNQQFPSISNVTESSYPDEYEDGYWMEDWTSRCEAIDKIGEYDRQMEFWTCGIILNIVGILGIIGNIISMIILSRPQMRSGINYLLIGLAICDTVLIITSMLLFGIPSIYPYTGYMFTYYNYIYPYISPTIFPVAMSAQTASIYITFAVTLERYVAVCHPLKARVLCTYGRAKMYFVICLIFAVLYNLPRFFEVQTVSYQPPENPIVLHCVRPSLLRRNLTYINIYIHWCYLIVNYMIPFANLAIFNCLIYRQVKRANRERHRLSRIEKREIGLATMLLCVVIVFFLFNFLALVLNIYEAFYNFIDHTLTKVSNLLVTINSCCNFLIYVLFGEKFKRIFLMIFCNGRFRRDHPDFIQYESSISNKSNEISSFKKSTVRFSRYTTQRSTISNHIYPESISNINHNLNANANNSSNGNELGREYPMPLRFTSA